MNLYTDHDDKVCAWLSELVKAGHLPAADVRTAGIESFTLADVAEYEQVHFFAGIGGWPLAFKMAGGIWNGSSGLTIWSGSCPCQPFSDAGKRRGIADERHLWPEFARLIAERRPSVVVGEQVASAAGRGWLAGVRTDLEAMGYVVVAADLCAASVGAPHIRQRLWWVGIASGQRPQGLNTARATPRAVERACVACGYPFDHDLLGKYGCPNCEGHGGVGDAAAGRLGQALPSDTSDHVGHARAAGGVSDCNGAGRRPRCQSRSTEPGRTDCQGARAVDSGRGGAVARGLPDAQPLRARPRITGEQGQAGIGGRGPANHGPWNDYILVPCADGKTRRIEPGTRPLVDGVPARVVRLRGFGNAIVPQIAATFLRAVEEVMRECDL